MRPPNLPLIKIKDVHLKNPFAVLPHPTKVTYPVGKVTPPVLMHYKARAQCEAAVVITGPATVTPPTSRKTSLLRVDQPKYLDGLRALCKIIETNGALPGIQIVHTGNHDAGTILEGGQSFEDDLGEFINERLYSAYRNACSRSAEVGFRYVELGGCYQLLLHQLIEEDRAQVIERLFDTALETLNDSFLMGLRLHAQSPHHDKYARMFLEKGGDIVCFESGSESVDAMHEAHYAEQMVNLYKTFPSADLHRLLSACRLLGLPPGFREKHRQVLEFFG